MLNRIHIGSEIGKLRGVIVHRPGGELEHLIPGELEDMLFEEIPWLRRADAEHDGFVSAISSRGAEVFYIEEMAEEIIGDRKLKGELIREHLKMSTIVDDEARGIIYDYLMDLDDRSTVEMIISGIPKYIVKGLRTEKTFSEITYETHPFYLDPLPSMYFTRDHGAVIGDNLLVSQMFGFARRRETIFIRFVQKHHPLFRNAKCGLWFDGEIPTGIEGGDILVLNRDTIIIGLSQRTSEAAIETVARRLLVEQNVLRRIIVLQIPARRAYMHLDTVFTMIDHDKFLMFPGIREHIKVYELTAGRNNHVEARMTDSLETALSESLGVSGIEILFSGGDSIITAAREQWGDSTNAFALEPGVVVTYNRNEETNRMLRNRGIDVIEVEGSELVRGRGGPRCMTLPLLRDDI